MAMNKRRLKQVVIALAVMLTMSGSALALLPGIGGGFIVYDPLLEAALNTQFAKSILQQVTEFKLHENVQRYRELINGGWKDPIQVAEVTQTTLATFGVDIKLLGWGKDDRFKKEKSTRAVGEALEELNDILTQGANKKQMEKVRGHIEEIYGDVPVTRAGAAVEQTYRDMASTAAFTGEANKAIKELMAEADRIKEQIESGGVVPGDLERYQIQEADLRFRAQLLQTQSMNHQNRLLMNIAGMKAAEEGRLERARLKDRYDRLELMSGIMLSPAMRKSEGRE